jgi:hypothetical protein
LTRGPGLSRAFARLSMHAHSLASYTHPRLVGAYTRFNSCNVTCYAITRRPARLHTHTTHTHNTRDVLCNHARAARRHAHRVAGRRRRRRGLGAAQVDGEVGEDGAVVRARHAPRARVGRHVHRACPARRPARLSVPCLCTLGSCTHNTHTTHTQHTHDTHTHTHTHTHTIHTTHHTPHTLPLYTQLLRRPARATPRSRQPAQNYRATIRNKQFRIIRSAGRPAPRREAVSPCAGVPNTRVRAVGPSGRRPCAA